MSGERSEARSVLERALRWWDRHVANPYRPERHYMRGRPAAVRTPANDDSAEAPACDDRRRA